MEITIEEINVEAEVALERQVIENKLGRLDILAVIDENTHINIEVQVADEHNFIDRALYYWAGNYYNSLKKGNNYKKAPKTVSINILRFDLFKDEGEYHEKALIRREFRNKILTEKLEMHFIQIPKFLRKNKKESKKLDQWMYFISQADRGRVELAMKKNREIKKANEEYEYLTGDAAEQRIAFLREKAIKDEVTNREGAMEEGVKKGIKEGIKEGIKKGMIKEKEKIAKMMLKESIEITLIEKLTGLCKDEIIRIEKNS